jgi:hypothetical protein
MIAGGAESGLCIAWWEQGHGRGLQEQQRGGSAHSSMKLNM